MGNAQKKVKKYAENSKKKVNRKDNDTSKFNAILITVAVVLGVAILVGVIAAVISGVKSKTADPGEIVSIESKHYDVSNGMLSYFLYSDYYSALSGTNGVYYLYYYGLDTSKSLKNQECKIDTSGNSSNMTWFDYFLSNSVNSISNYLFFAEKAYDVGTKLDDDDNAEIEKSVAAIKDSAEDLGYDYNEYIEFMFGEGVKEQDIREALELRTLADKQYKLDKDAIKYTDEEILAEYDKDPKKYQYTDYLTYVCNADYPEDEEDTEGRSAAETFARKRAEALAECKDEESFLAKVKEYLEEDNASLETPLTEDEIQSKLDAAKMTEQAYSEDSKYCEWAFAEGRAEGDTTVLEESSGKYIAYYLIETPYKLLYNTKNVRHILISVASDADEATAAEAEAKANEVIEKFNATSKTEDDFDALAKEYNEDSASLYENVTKGQMVSEFENWLFDEARKPGEVGIVKTTYGYHVMYFVGDGPEAWNAQVNNDLVSAALEEVVNGYAEKYDVSYDRDLLYKLSGFTAYSKEAPASSKTEDTTDAADTTAAADTTDAVTTAADDTAPVETVPADDTAPVETVPADEVTDAGEEVEETTDAEVTEG